MSRGQRVRRWVPADLERIGLVHSRSRQDAYASLVPVEALARVTPEQQVRVWTARLATLPEQHAALVVEHEGEVVGFALAQLDAESGAELNAIHVLPEHHGTGAGQALMDAVVEAIAAYRDTLKLLLTFVHARTGKLPAQLDWDNLDATTIAAFRKLSRCETSGG